MATRYFSQAGDDTTGNGTQLLPYKTRAKATSVSVAGDTLLFNKGDTWTSADAPLTISSKNGVTVGAYGTGANPVFQGSVTFDNIDVADAQTCTISDIYFQCDSGDGTNISIGGNVTGIVVHDCRFNDGTYAIQGGSVTGTGIFYNCYSRRMKEDCFSTHSTFTFEAYNCTFVETDFGWVDPNGSKGDAISTHDTGTSNVHHCFFYDCKRANRSVNSSGTSVFHHNLVISNNQPHLLLQQVGGSMIAYDNIFICTGTYQTVVVGQQSGVLTFYNNTIINTSSHASTINILANTSATVNLVNNISVLAGNTGYHVSIDITGLGGTTLLTSDYNCYYPVASNNFDAVAAQVNFTSWQAGFDTHGLGTDPLLVNRVTPASASHAKLTASSPCRNVAFDLTGAGGFSTDYSDFARGSIWDMGAYEFRASAGGLLRRRRRI